MCQFGHDGGARHFSVRHGVTGVPFLGPACSLPSGSRGVGPKFGGFNVGVLCGSCCSVV
jgi:hypothetical protein